MKKLIQIMLALVLMYLAFRKIDVQELLKSLFDLPLPLIVFTIFYSFFASLVSSWRWGLILFKRPRIADILFLTRCSYTAAFYSLFMPSSLSGDIVKWIPLINRYPGQGKIKFAGSVLIDRVLGATAFFPTALLAVIIGKLCNFSIPVYLYWVFGLGCLFTGIFYISVYLVNFEKMLSRYEFTNKLFNVILLLKQENKALLFKVFLVSVIVQVVTIFPVWVRSLFLDAGFPLLSVYVFMPIISLILILPLSFAGFGAREQLFLLFFSQVGAVNQKILLVATFSGIVNFLVAFIGGLLTLPIIPKSAGSIRKNRHTKVYIE